MKYGLSLETIQKINSIFIKYHEVKKVLLYGSRAKGNFKNGSDIDLTMIGDDDLDTKILYKIEDEIDDLLLPYQIDLSIFKQSENQELINHINRVGLVFYKQN